LALSVPGLVRVVTARALLLLLVAALRLTRLILALVLAEILALLVSVFHDYCLLERDALNLGRTREPVRAFGHRVRYWSNRYGVACADGRVPNSLTNARRCAQSDRSI